MKKNYFIFLGKNGLIYYSWLFVVLFIGLILGYEGTSKINWPAIIFIVIFFIILIYSLLSSYYTESYLKLPYKIKMPLKQAPNKVWAWRVFNIYQVRIDNLHQYFLFRIEKNKVESGK
ncbi:hypothetical protein GCM10022297_13850 [Lactobacillus hamsteri]|uniref:hypothetical protein n=1 Tax=Lactobacillus hamsteri TaxID=96565 RepID=UPI000468555F|nr:hypothetical protein [Lactobacillus hamsteri]